MEMSVNEIRAAAIEKVLVELMPVLEQNEAVKFADKSFAILETIGNQEVWVEVSLKTKAWKDTKKSKAFDPYEAAAEWEEEKKIAAGVKAQKEAEKAAKIKKDKGV